MSVLRTILFFVLLQNLLQAQDFATDRFLFVLTKKSPALQLWHGKVQNSSTQLEKLLTRYKVGKVQKWLHSADESDVYGDIDFSKVYRAVLSSKYREANLHNILTDFKMLPEITATHLESRIKISSPSQPLIPRDPFYKNQWHLSRIAAEYAWGLWLNQMPGDSTMIVGVVDTGLDYLHPDIEQVVYINPAEDLNGDGFFTEADINNIDDDGNGFIDDVRGWDFSAANDTYAGDNDIRPPKAGNNSILSHGTHVAGIMAADTDNEIGISGITFRSRILATKQSLDDDLSDGYLYNAYDGILYCAKMGAEIINCSWGGNYYSVLAQDLINHVVNDYGSIIVCAAGNDNSNNDTHHHYPSDYSNTIAVAALNSSDQKASFSNYGEIIDISAPGTGILSTIHGGYASWQGTSMASPVVAGTLALLHSWFPDANREWLINELYASADNINKVNPSYDGKLGAGRVNIYKPIASKLFPAVHLTHFNFEILDDAGDGQLSPGDRARVKLTIQNTSGWRDATHLRIALNSMSPFITFPDSVTEIALLASGSSDSLPTATLTMQIAENAPYQPFLIEFNYTANSDSVHPYYDKEQQQMTVSANHTGFPKKDLSIRQPLASAAFGPDAVEGLVTVGTDNHLTIFDEQGRVFAGFPVNLNSFTDMPPIIADFDSDGFNEIVIVNRKGLLQAFRWDGSILFAADIQKAVYGTASAADFDQDGIPEIVFGSMDKKLHAIKSDSSELAGFPLETSSFINLGIALADFDGDQIPEMIYGTYEGKLHIRKVSGEELSSWPQQIEGRLACTPLIIKGHDDLHIITLNTVHQLQIFNDQAHPISSYDFQTSVTAQPAFSDLDGDGLPEIVFPTDDGLLHIVQLDGTTLGHSPIQLNGVMRTSAIFSAPDDLGRKNIIAATETGMLYIIDKDGVNLQHYPALFETDFIASPVIADLDGDGKAEISCAGNLGLYVIDAQFEVDSLKSWNTILGDNLRSAYYQTETALALQSEKSYIINDFDLHQNYPNPFNPLTIINYQLPIANHVEITVYNVLGQRVKTLVNGKREAGNYSISFNASGLANGIYIYKLSAGGYSQMHKMIYLK